MNSLKTPFLAFLLCMSGILSFPSQAAAQTTVNYKWNTTLFALGTTPSSPINTAGNWTSGTGTSGGSIYLSYFSASYTGLPAPSLQELIDCIRAEYDRIYPALFTNGYTFIKIINGVSVQIKIYLRNS